MKLFKKDINAQDKDTGFTPLTKACLAGDVAEVERLLQRGADVNRPKTQNETPLFVAVSYGQTAVATKLLAAGADKNHGNFDGQTPLFAAAELGHAPLVELLVQQGVQVDRPDYHGTTPLAAAARKGKHDIVKSLLAKGAKVDAEDNQGTTPLIMAAKAGETLVMRVLLDGGAAIDHQNNREETALYTAVFNNRTAAVDLLLKKGANRSLSCRGQTARECAAHTNREPIVKLFDSVAEQTLVERHNSFNNNSASRSIALPVAANNANNNNNLNGNGNANNMVYGTNKFLTNTPAVPPANAEKPRKNSNAAATAATTTTTDNNSQRNRNSNGSANSISNSNRAKKTDEVDDIYRVPGALVAVAAALQRAKELIFDDVEEKPANEQLVALLMSLQLQPLIPVFQRQGVTVPQLMVATSAAELAMTFQISQAAAERLYNHFHPSLAEQQQQDFFFRPVDHSQHGRWVRGPTVQLTGEGDDVVLFRCPPAETIVDYRMFVTDNSNASYKVYCFSGPMAFHYVPRQHNAVNLQIDLETAISIYTALKRREGGEVHDVVAVYSKVSSPFFGSKGKLTLELLPRIDRRK